MEEHALSEVQRAYQAGASSSVPDVALVSIAISLKRIADAQERQAAVMDTMPPVVPFDDQLAAVAAMVTPKG